LDGFKESVMRINGEAARPPGLINRELSWLDFNARVLALAEDTGIGLLERLNFLSIYSRNLDEFFQVRVSGLQEQVNAGVARSGSEGTAAQPLLELIRHRVTELAARQMHIYSELFVPALAAEDIRFFDYGAVGEGDRAFLNRVFEDRLFPVLTPLAVDPAHPFPYISNLSLNLVVVIGDRGAGEPRIARVKVPPLLPRFIELPHAGHFVPIEQVIAAHLHMLFPGMEVLRRHVFRVTRDADFSLNEDDMEDLLAAVENVLRLRRRSPRAVRLEVDTGMSEDVRALLLDELSLEAKDVYEVDGPLDLGSLSELMRLNVPKLKYPRWVPVTQARLMPGEDDHRTDIFRVLKAGDVLVHHPYDSFSTSVEAFIEQAARDPNVLAIKQTLYRTSSPDSPIAKSLIRAAEEGKQVVAVVEVTARFDEEKNIAWARRLEDAGAHIVYGTIGLKTHAKVSLIVRREDGGIRRYTHVGTGNYNPITANLYEDIGLLSADPELGADVADLFNLLTGYSKQSRYHKLLIAPFGLRAAVLELIAAEVASGDGRIVMKVNNLVDSEIINALYAASQAGVEIDLVVRGMCCLRPGVRGISDTIRVRCILGRYLEHSRIFRFGSTARGPKYYIGSADLMPRNLDRRIEATVPVLDPALRSRLQEILDVLLSDDSLMWTLDGEGEWQLTPVSPDRHPQRRLQELALGRLATHAESIA